VALLAGGVLGLLLLNRNPAPTGDAGTPSPSATVHATVQASASGSATPSVSGSSAPTGTPASEEPTVGELRWRQVASHGEPPGPAFAYDVAVGGPGLVAVGTQYLGAIPNVGPTPQHEGRVWLSSDGTSWEDVTPPNTFANVDLRNLVPAPNGALIAVGLVHEVSGAGPLEPVGTAAWESSDARAWTEIELGLPEATGARLEQGPRGYLALVAAVDGSPGQELWFSHDAREWERVDALPAVGTEIEAGDEGFAAVGAVVSGGEIQGSFARASADGTEWLDAPTSPPWSVQLAAIGPDWLAVSHVADSGLPDHATTWISANGLDWTEHGAVTLNVVPVEGSSTCTEIPSALTASDQWVVLGSTLSFGCSEGGFVVHGTQRISTDGASWEDLPFAAGTPGTSGSGSAVMSSASVDGALVLVGQSNGQAAFWIGEAP
jgi:hypothetical protein